MKKHSLLIIALLPVLLSGCTSTFMGTLLVLSFKDFIYYVLIAFFMAITISLKGGGNEKRAFWIWFILDLLLTPLAGFIYLLILFSRKS